jgi:RES domain-containing protein
VAREVFVEFWRLARETPRYAADDLSGAGAAIAGGRWNAQGQAVVYAASTLSLAALEVLVHTSSTDIHVRNLFAVRIRVPKAIVDAAEKLDPAKLNPAWSAQPAGISSIEAGQEWLKANRAALLFVPSVVVPEEWNILINPGHAGAKLIRAAIVRQFLFDTRLKSAL